MVIRCREFRLSEKSESVHEESPNNVAVNDQENQNIKQKEAQNKLWDENPGKNKVAAGNFSHAGGGLNPPSKTAVFKINMPCKCDGCTLKVKKSIRNLSGVEDVRAESPGRDMLTVTGKMELAKVQEIIEQMTRNKAELLSFWPKIDADSVTGNDDIKFDKKSEKKLEQEKGEIINKELQQQHRMVTAVFKISLHCEGCTKKVKKAVYRLEGVKGVNADIAANKLMVVGKVEPVEMRALLQRMFKTQVLLLYPHSNNKPSQIKETMVDATENGDKKMDNNLEKKTDVKVVEDHKPKVQELGANEESNGKAQQNGKVIMKIDGVDSVSIDGAKNVVKLRGTLMSMNVQDLGSANIKDKELNQKPLGLIVPYKDAQRTTNISNKNDDHERLLSNYNQHSYLTLDHVLSLITNNKNGGPIRQKIEATGAGGDVIGVKVKVVNNWYPPPPPPPPPPPNMWESGGYIMSQPEIRYMDHQIFSDENPNSCCII